MVSQALKTPLLQYQIQPLSIQSHKPQLNIILDAKILSCIATGSWKTEPLGRRVAFAFCAADHQSSRKSYDGH